MEKARNLLAGVGRCGKLCNDGLLQPKIAEEDGSHLPHSASLWKVFVPRATGAGLC